MLLKIQPSDVSSARLKDEIKAQVRQVMLLAQDDLWLLEAVGRGEQTFRITFIRAFPRGTVNETIANKVFAFFCAQVVQRFGNTPVRELLDALEVNVKRPPTNEEIESSWEITTASSEEARRAFGLPTGDTYKPQREH